MSRCFWRSFTLLCIVLALFPGATVVLSVGAAEDVEAEDVRGTGDRDTPVRGAPGAEDDAAESMRERDEELESMDDEMDGIEHENAPPDINKNPSTPRKKRNHYNYVFFIFIYHRDKYF